MSADPYKHDPDLTDEDREAILNHLHESVDKMLMDPDDVTTWNSKYVDEL